MVGSQSARASAQQIIDLTAQFSIFNNRFESFTKDSIERDWQQSTSLSELKAKLEEHEKDDQRVRQEIERIDRIQQEHIQQEHDGKH